MKNEMGHVSLKRFLIKKGATQFKLRCGLTYRGRLRDVTTTQV